MFIDQARIFVKAGEGGDGSSSFRREKYVPRGGPDGGDGGRGGNILLMASRQLNTLLDLRYQQRYQAKAGGRGEGSNRQGRRGSDIVIRVPVGTIIFDDEANEQIADLTVDGQSCMVARGGKGGRGNARFATPTNRAPIQWEPGEPGQERWLRLELKLLADVGLVGFPNAGKSTLIATISAARPKIADYPFTTLEPNLGVVEWAEGRTCVVADIPGLIEGAHTGKGLGFQFLRHIERTAFLLHLIDVSEGGGEDPVRSLETLRTELSSYDPGLLARPFAVVATKVDAKGTGQHLEALRAHCHRQGLRCFTISAVTRQGLDALVRAVGQEVEAIRTSCAIG